MAIRLTPKEMAMRGLTPTGEKLKPEETEQGWLIPGGIDPRTGAMTSMPSLPTVPGVSTPSTTVKTTDRMTRRITPSTGTEPSAIAGITIPITSEELKKIADAEAKGQCVGAMRAYYTPKKYKITLRGGGEIYVEALTKKTAEQKVKDAGYKVAWVTKVIGAPPTTPSAIAVEREVREGSIKLDSGEWVSREFYETLPKNLHGKLNTLGVDGYNQWQTENVGANVKASGSRFLIDAYDSGGIDGYNNAVGEYNQVVRDANWLNLYNTYRQNSDKDWFQDNWEWFQKTYSDKLKDTKYMEYIQGGKFQEKYADVVQPTNIPNYALIKDYIKPSGFDSEGAFEAGKDNPSHAAQIISTTNRFVLAFASDETKANLNSGEWTLLPYGQIIETDKLERMPPTYRQMVETSGLCGYEDYQEKVIEWNKSDNWFQYTIDRLGSQAVRLGQDIKNFVLLEFSATFPKVKEGDPKPVIDPSTLDVGSIYGFTKPTGTPTYTAEEAAELNAARAKAQKYYKDLYDEAEMAAQEWHASRPSLASIYPDGFVDSVKEDPSTLKDPRLWTEVIANTLPYTVATGLIVGGFVGAGPAGVAATAPLAFGITLSVEGHDIYKDAIAHGASHDQALKLANIYGSISASIETLGDSIFVGVLGFGGGAFASALGKNVGGNIIRGAAKKYGWRTLTAGMIKDFVNQGGQEFFQEVVHNAAIKTVNENQALLENTANAFVSGVIGTAPFVLIPAGGQTIRGVQSAKVGDVRAGKAGAQGLTPIDITPQMQVKILNRVFAPVSGFTIQTKTAVAEQLKGTPAQIEYWKQRYKEGEGRKIYEAGKTISVGLVDKKTVVTGKANVDEVALAYNEMCAKVNEYAGVQLKLKQAWQAISNFGMAKSKSQLKTLNEYKKAAKELEAKLKELKGPMVEAVHNFSKVFLKNSVGLETEQKAEVRKMAKTIAMDIDSVTTQLFGERNAKEIAKDIKELEEQIKVIEDETSKGVTRGQLEGYARLINTLKGQVGDLVNELRTRYLAEGEKIKPDTKKLAMEVMSLQARLTKAVENLQNFSGSALNYDIYRKGELAHEAGVVKLERDTFEAIQKTTEAIWGKEHYADKLTELNTALSNLVAIMKEANISHQRVAGIGFNIYDAIREKRKSKALKKTLESLKTEVNKVKDAALRQQAEAQEQAVKKVVEDLARESPTELRRTKPTEGVKAPTERYTLEYTDADFGAAQNERIHREAERIVGDRFHKLLDHAPSYVRKRTGQELMDYLHEIYDSEYFKTVHDGIFKDLEDYLSVENEEARIRMQVEHQGWLQKMDQQIVSLKAEADLAKDLADDEPGAKRRDTLDKHRDKTKQKSDALKRELKQKQKTRVAVAESAETLSAAEKAKLEEIRDRVIEERLQRLKDKLKSEEKAKKLIETAKKELAKKEEPKGKVKEKVKERVEEEARKEESAFPRISTKTKERIMAQCMAAISTKNRTRTKAAIETAVEAAVQTYRKTQTQAATQTQTETAIQAAVKTVLKEETETATKEELETATRIITEIVTQTKIPPKPPPPPPRFKMEPVKGRKKKLPVDPALVCWKQGMYYISVFPPFRAGSKKMDVIYSRHKPPWGEMARGRHSPRRSLKGIGKVPPLIELPMGVVTARVRHGRKLTFSRRSRRKKRVA